MIATNTRTPSNGHTNGHPSQTLFKAEDRIASGVVEHSQPVYFPPEKIEAMNTHALRKAVRSKNRMEHRCWVSRVFPWWNKRDMQLLLMNDRYAVEAANRNH